MWAKQHIDKNPAGFSEAYWKLSVPHWRQMLQCHQLSSSVGMYWLLHRQTGWMGAQAWTRIRWAGAGKGPSTGFARKM